MAPDTIGPCGILAPLICTTRVLFTSPVDRIRTLLNIITTAYGYILDDKSLRRSSGKHRFQHQNIPRLKQDKPTGALVPRRFGIRLLYKITVKKFAAKSINKYITITATEIIYIYSTPLACTIRTSQALKVQHKQASSFYLAHCRDVTTPISKAVVPSQSISARASLLRKQPRIQSSAPCIQSGLALPLSSPPLAHTSSFPRHQQMAVALDGRDQDSYR